MVLAFLLGVEDSSTGKRVEGYAGKGKELLKLRVLMNLIKFSFKS